MLRQSVLALVLSATLLGQQAPLLAGEPAAPRCEECAAASADAMPRPDNREERRHPVREGLRRVANIVAFPFVVPLILVCGLPGCCAR
jgi:hypothetical protein